MVSSEVPEVFTGKQMKDVSIMIVKASDVSIFVHGYFTNKWTRRTYVCWEYVVEPELLILSRNTRRSIALKGESNFTSQSWISKQNTANSSTVGGFALMRVEISLIDDKNSLRNSDLFSNKGASFRSISPSTSPQSFSIIVCMVICLVQVAQTFQSFTARVCSASITVYNTLHIISQVTGQYYSLCDSTLQWDYRSSHKAPRLVRELKSAAMAFVDILPGVEW